MTPINKMILPLLILIIILIIIIGALTITNFYPEEDDEENNAIYGEQVEYYTNVPGETVGHGEIIPKTIDFKCESGEVIEIVEGEYTIKVDVIGKENGLCEVFATLTQAPGFEALLIGSNATCFLTQNEINNLNENTDISKLNCEGVLYELAKAR